MLTIKIFAMTGCGRCKKVMRDVIDLIESVKAELPESVIEIINISEQPEIAIQYGIITTPTILIGEAIVLHGLPTKERLLKSIRKGLSEIAVDEENKDGTREIGGNQDRPYSIR